MLDDTYCLSTLEINMSICLLMLTFETYVDMQLIYVDMPEQYVDMQPIYASIDVFMLTFNLLMFNSENNILTCHLFMLTFNGVCII